MIKSTDQTQNTPAQSLRNTTLDDKYTARDGQIYLSGIQALVRLPLVQKWRDEAAGLKTGGFISGYRGSPLGGLDEALWKAQKFLEKSDIHFQPGINEDLALTAVWGSQHVSLTGESKYQGVFSLWYAKGPGVDRSIDVLKHANHHGSSAKGGVLLVAGDDHGAYSSTLPHQSDHVFAASMVPVLYPSNVGEYIELGLHGWAMSRFSGCFVGFKALADTVESSASISADPYSLKTEIPTDFVTPFGGLHARQSALSLAQTARAQEALMQDYKIYAALAYCRRNGLNRTTLRGANDRLGIVASGKSYMDVVEALQELGLSDQKLKEIGVRLFKVSMPWPLEPDSMREFAIGLEEILVVEEKRQIVEYQLKEQLYNWRDDVRPRIIGKFDEKGEWVHPRGEWLLTPKADFSVAQIARVIASRITRFHNSPQIAVRLQLIDSKQASLASAAETPSRPAYYCSGCPHNTSTKVPEGSIALAGIGCHIMAATIYPEHNKTTTHMGGEGVTWIGQAPFSERKHVFANMGDGTYFHSGYLAIRASKAAGVNITYKILFNDAVAMTGGQPIDGQVTVPMLASQLAAEGLKHIAIVSDEPNRYLNGQGLPTGVKVHHRDLLDSIQREFRTYDGVSAIIYDQTCAAEKRRRRKKKLLPDPAKRLFINEAVCEGCGDCGSASNCVSLLPLETELGRKRQIDQSNCNKDFSCLKGFCPSFVTIEGGALRKPEKAQFNIHSFLDDIPVPMSAANTGIHNILIGGIGGTGVITIGALLGMAAHLEGKSVSVLDMTGMSQKNGSVTSHVRIGAAGTTISAQRIATGEADLILGCDMLTAGSQESISKTQAGRTQAIINLHQQPPGSFTKDPDWQFPTEKLRKLIHDSTGGQAQFIDASRIATRLLGDSIATNLFMLGYAYQRSHIPLSIASILRAIELNGVAVAMNTEAFHWGRIAAWKPDMVEKLAGDVEPIGVIRTRTLEEIIKSRYELLIEYQNEAYAKSYAAIVQKLQAKEMMLTDHQYPLTRAAAKYLYKLMAYKDEYEVARLYSSVEFKKRIADNFSGNFKIKLNLAPPLFSTKDENGHLIKSEYGEWALKLMPFLAWLKFLRGTPFDIFGKTNERRQERQLIIDYVSLLEKATTELTKENHGKWISIAKVPEQIRGFGHVKEESIKRARAHWRELCA